jgi:hypothetical protein
MMLCRDRLVGAMSKRTFAARRAPVRPILVRPDPDAKLYRKGAGMEAKPAFLGHALMKNRRGLVVDACLTQAGGHASTSRP